MAMLVALKAWSEGGPPALTGTREYEQSDRNRQQAEGGRKEGNVFICRRTQPSEWSHNLGVWLYIP